ncbi:MAG: hypothetical protein IJD01_07595, partial [Clostridia bacterium]|nr:hypothetical protein [Clostridia bacterium]
MYKIDFHSHILPRVDDGASSREVSGLMLRALADQKVDTVVLTPHYYSDHEPIEAFLRRREKARLIPTESDSFPLLRYGAEVRFSEYLFNNRDLSALCIDGTRTMLLELPFNKPVTEGTVQSIDRLITEYAITPVLAHIERYGSLLRSRRLMDEMIDLGCVLQVNLSSFCMFGKRRLFSLLNDGYIGALGTDSHNLTSRPPDYTSGYERILR